ncbi:MAG: sugar ABC transporter permease [Defluviitaleaceae bacterium]|nr:sugar ABC transporter permease [Defluviitaleaceae bacterium]
MNMRRLKRARSATYVLLAPYFVLFFLFTALPVAISIFFSFTNFNMLQAPSFVGWGNYMRLLLDDDIFIIAVRNTLIFAVITGPISYLMCFMFAWIINELPPKLRSVMTLIFYAPSISGNIFFIWQVFFSSDRQGWLNAFLLNAGFISTAIEWLNTEAYVLPILILVQLWLSLGVGFLAFIAGLQTVDKSLYEAAAVDGIRNRWQELWFITLPCMKPQLMFGAVIQITMAFSVSEVSIQLAGFPSVNYAGHTVATHLMDFGTHRFEMGYASAIATVLFLAMILTNKGVQRLLRKVGS